MYQTLNIIFSVVIIHHFRYFYLSGETPLLGLVMNKIVVVEILVWCCDSGMMNEVRVVEIWVLVLWRA